MVRAIYQLWRGRHTRARLIVVVIIGAAVRAAIMRSAAMAAVSAAAEAAALRLIDSHYGNLIAAWMRSINSGGRRLRAASFRIT